MPLPIHLNWPAENEYRLRLLTEITHCHLPLLLLLILLHDYKS